MNLNFQQQLTQEISQQTSEVWNRLGLTSNEREQALHDILQHINQSITQFIQKQHEECNTIQQEIEKLRENIHELRQQLCNTDPLPTHQGPLKDQLVQYIDEQTTLNKQLHENQRQIVELYNQLITINNNLGTDMDDFCDITFLPQINNNNIHNISMFSDNGMSINSHTDVSNPLCIQPSFRNIELLKQKLKERTDIYASHQSAASILIPRVVSCILSMNFYDDLRQIEQNKQQWNNQSREIAEYGATDICSTLQTDRLYRVDAFDQILCNNISWEHARALWEQNNDYQIHSWDAWRLSREFCADLRHKYDLLQQICEERTKAYLHIMDQLITLEQSVPLYNSNNDFTHQLLSQCDVGKMIISLQTLRDLQLLFLQRSKTIQQHISQWLDEEYNKLLSNFDLLYIDEDSRNEILYEYNNSSKTDMEKLKFLKDHNEHYNMKKKLMQPLCDKLDMFDVDLASTNGVPNNNTTPLNTTIQKNNTNGRVIPTNTLSMKKKLDKTAIKLYMMIEKFQAQQQIVIQHKGKPALDTLKRTSNFSRGHHNVLYSGVDKIRRMSAEKELQLLMNLALNGSYTNSDSINGGLNSSCINTSDSTNSSIKNNIQKKSPNTTQGSILTRKLLQQKTNNKAAANLAATKHDGIKSNQSSQVTNNASRAKSMINLPKQSQISQSHHSSTYNQGKKVTQPLTNTPVKSTLPQRQRAPNLLQQQHSQQQQSQPQQQQKRTITAQKQYSKAEPSTKTTTNYSAQKKTAIPRTAPDNGPLGRLPRPLSNPTQKSLATSTRPTVIPTIRSNIQRSTPSTTATIAKPLASAIKRPGNGTSPANSRNLDTVKKQKNNENIH